MAAAPPGGRTHWRTNYGGGMGERAAVWGVPDRGRGRRGLGGCGGGCGGGRVGIRAWPNASPGRPQETPYGWLFDGVGPRSGSGMTGVGGMVVGGLDCAV